MTFFQRIRTPFGESAVDEQARYQPRARLVGELLQEHREELGLDLEEIGAMLRIKPTYLAALEQGRTQDLPGPTYAIGFVRAYAEFLGLDATPVLARFKAEASGVTARPDLALPVPLGERSLPGGALVLVALILALCGYGIWYYLSTEERSRPERVAAVPAALKPTPPTASLVAPPTASSSSSAAPSASRAPDAGSPPNAPSLFGAAAGPGQQAPASATPTSPAMPPSMTAPGPTAAPGPPPAPTSNASASPPAAPQTPAAPASPLSTGILLTPVHAPALQPASTPPAPPQAVQTAAAPPPAAAPSPTAAAAPPAAASSAAPGAGRVAIRATADCWIQVRASDQSIVFSKVLKAGEIYAVPARAGLSLRTGNAGVLEITVDGKTAPSIGGIGALRRDVALDPAELAAGTAVHG